MPEFTALPPGPGVGDAVIARFEAALADRFEAGEFRLAIGASGHSGLCLWGLEHAIGREAAYRVTGAQSPFADFAGLCAPSHPWSGRDASTAQRGSLRSPLCCAQHDKALWEWLTAVTRGENACIWIVFTKGNLNSDGDVVG